MEVGGGGWRRSGGSANEGWETRGREGRNVIKTGKREIGGKRGKARCTADLCQLYNFLQRMPSTLPSPPTPRPCLSLAPLAALPPSSISSRPTRVCCSAPPRRGSRPRPHQPVIKILPRCDCSTWQMEDWT